MFGFEHNDIDPHNDIARRVLKVCLRMNLPSMQEGLQYIIDQALAQVLLSDTGHEGYLSSGN